MTFNRTVPKPRSPRNLHRPRWTQRVRFYTCALPVRDGDPILADARAYVAEGVHVVPVPIRRKGPVVPGWQNLRLTGADLETHFSNGKNGIGALTGQASGGLIDIDLDVAEARIVAKRLLPPTARIHGRVGKPESHWWYRVAQQLRPEQFRDLDNKMLVELRSDGQQTVVPPSLHPSGERLEWERAGGPAVIDATALRRAIARVATAALVARHLPKNGRHETALALLGALLRAMWTEHEAEVFLQAIAEAAGYEARGRLRNVRSTARRLAEDRPTTGIPRLKALIGAAVTNRVCDWLGLGGVSNRPVSISLPAMTVRTPSHPQPFTLTDLLDKDFPEPRWAVYGLLPSGLAILASKPKMGKSALNRALSIAVASGGVVLGQIAVMQGEVLYLALEDHQRRLKEKYTALLYDTVAPGGLYLHTAWPRFDQGGLDMLSDWLNAHPDTRLIMIDTFARVRPPRHKGGDLYAEDYAAITPLKALADEHDVAILVDHHLSKRESDDLVDLVSGSTGLTGAADTILVLRRARGQASATLFGTGREVEERELALRFDRVTQSWGWLCDAEVNAHSDEERRVIDLLRTSGPLQIQAIAQGLNKGEDATYKLMSRMAEKGKVIRLARGVYALPDAETGQEGQECQDRGAERPLA